MLDSVVTGGKEDHGQEGMIMTKEIMEKKDMTGCENPHEQGQRNGNVDVV